VDSISGDVVLERKVGISEGVYSVTLRLPHHDKDIKMRIEDEK
jgi:hypothetical protein